MYFTHCILCLCTTWGVHVCLSVLCSVHCVVGYGMKGCFYKTLAARSAWDRAPKLTSMGALGVIVWSYICARILSEQRYILSTQGEILSTEKHILQAHQLYFKKKLHLSKQKHILCAQTGRCARSLPPSCSRSTSLALRAQVWSLRRRSLSLAHTLQMCHKTNQSETWQKYVLIGCLLSNWIAGYFNPEKTKEIASDGLGLDEEDVF